MHHLLRFVPQEQSEIRSKAVIPMHP